MKKLSNLLVLLFLCLSSVKFIYAERLYLTNDIYFEKPKIELEVNSSSPNTKYSKTIILEDFVLKKKDKNNYFYVEATYYGGEKKPSYTKQEQIEGHVGKGKRELKSLACTNIKETISSKTINGFNVTSFITTGIKNNKKYHTEEILVYDDYDTENEMYRSFWIYYVCSDNLLKYANEMINSVNKE
ncbi:hypothetical protein [Candidatus Ruminimicrobiellum ovillum]|uniref:hypothetical protein n=1 Tax=Candidatus Ruminimicrobiellum ovillum TaxID=1947927 RepID=UPI00355A38AA